MEHHNPLLTNLKSDHKFITIGEIMLRLTPPNYQKIRMANEFEATYGGAEANVAAAENARNADALIAAENERVEAARREADAKIRAIEEELQQALALLTKIRETHAPAPAPEAPPAPAPAATPAEPGDMADEISQNLEALVGTTQDTAPKAPPKHPASDTSSKFANLQFGRNYPQQGTPGNQ